MYYHLYHMRISSNWQNFNPSFLKWSHTGNIILLTKIRPFNRFEDVPTEIGTNKIASIIEFRKKDLYEPLSRPKPECYQREKYSFANSILNTENTNKLPEINKTSNLKWSIGTIKSCTKENLVPKLQMFKEYNFIKKEKENVDHKPTYLSTDNISIRPREKSDEVKKLDFFQMKSKTFI